MTTEKDASCIELAELRNFVKVNLLSLGEDKISVKAKEDIDDYSMEECLVLMDEYNTYLAENRAHFISVYFKEDVVEDNTPTLEVDSSFFMPSM